MGDHAGELQRGNTRVGITDGEHAGELQRVDSRRNHRGGITEADLQRRQHAGIAERSCRGGARESQRMNTRELQRGNTQENSKGGDKKWNYRVSGGRAGDLFYTMPESKFSSNSQRQKPSKKHFKSSKTFIQKAKGKDLFRSLTF